MKRLTQAEKLKRILMNGDLSYCTEGYVYKPLNGEDEVMDCDNPFEFINYVVKKHRLI